MDRKQALDFHATSVSVVHNKKKAQTRRRSDGETEQRTDGLQVLDRCHAVFTDFIHRTGATGDSTQPSLNLELLCQSVSLLFSLWRRRNFFTAHVRVQCPNHSFMLYWIYPAEGHAGWSQSQTFSRWRRGSTAPKSAVQSAWSKETGMTLLQEDLTDCCFQKSGIWLVPLAEF